MRPALAAPLLALVLGSFGCGDIELSTENRDCDTRQGYHPDQDEDGVGADSPLYIGCEAPEGYVETGGDCDDTDPAITTCADTGDTGPQDTGDTAD